MIQFIETTGRSEEDAIAAALFQLNMERDDVSIEVLDRAKKGVFGFGGNPARVKVSYEVEGEETFTPTPAPAAAKVEAPAPAKVEAAAPAKVEKKTAPVAKKAAADDDCAQEISKFLVGLMAQMNVAATPAITATASGYDVVLEGEESLGALIGRRGETLDAIQQLASYSINRGRAKRVRIHIDAENYRAKREEALCRLAVKVAGKVVKYRKNVTLEAMNAYERHVIHSALQDFPGVETRSTGVDPNRRTVVTYAPDKK